MRFDAPSADVRIEDAGNGQCVVTDHLGIESLPRPAGQQPVFAVAGQKVGSNAGGLAIGGAHDHLFEHALGVPVVHEITRQPIEQLWMTGPFPLRTEIIQRLDQSGAKKHGPPAVNGHPRGQGLLFGDQPSREVEAVQRPAVWGWGDLRKKCRDSGRDLFAIEIVLAPDLDKSVAWFLHFCHDHGVGYGLFQIGLGLAFLGDTLLGERVFRRVGVAEERLQACLLFRAALISRNGGERSECGFSQLGDFSGGEGAFVKPEIIHASGKRGAGGSPAADAERLHRFDGIRQCVGHHGGCFKLSVHVHVHAGCFAGAVEGHGQMQERVGGQVTLALDVNGHGWPLADKMKAGLGPVEFHIPSAHAVG